MIDHAMRFISEDDLTPWQLRVVREKEVLDDNVKKLALFLDTDAFIELLDSERGRLLRQHSTMIEYSNILTERILAFDL